MHGFSPGEFFYQLFFSFQAFCYWLLFFVVTQSDQSISARFFTRFITLVDISLGLRPHETTPVVINLGIQQESVQRLSPMVLPKFNNIAILDSKRESQLAAGNICLSSTKPCLTYRAPLSLQVYFQAASSSASSQKHISNSQITFILSYTYTH